MALTLDDVQQTVCDTVKGIDVFKNFVLPDGDTLDAHIFADDGTMRDAIEESLKTFGWAVVIYPPIGVTTTSQVAPNAKSAPNHGSAKGDVLTVVTLRTNPKVNTGPTDQFKNRTAKVPIISTLRAIIKGVISWIPAPGETGFSLITERPFEPDFEDIGNYTYDVRFLKSVSF